MMVNGKSENPYQPIQNEYEAWLRNHWKNVPRNFKRPDFKMAAIQYAACRRELDQEFHKEYGFLK